MISVRLKKLDPAAVIPTYGSAAAAGADLYALCDAPLTIPAGETVLVHTGIAVEIPEGHVGLIFPRSSCYKNRMVLTNCVGVIDSDYRGEICAVFLGSFVDLQYKVGDRIAQMIILPIPAVEYQFAEELSTTERGTGGYGSTGK